MKGILAIILILTSPILNGQNDPCTTLEDLYKKNLFQEAYSFLQTEDFRTCQPQDYSLLKAKILMANYLYREAEYELEKIDSKEAKLLLKKSKYLIDLESKKSGAMMDAAEKYKRTSNSILLNVCDVVLIDTQITQSNFPIRTYSKAGYLPEDTEFSDNSKFLKWLNTQEYDEVLTGCITVDSIALITIYREEPFSRTNSSNYEIVGFNLKKNSPEKLKGFSFDGVSIMHPTSNIDEVVFAANFESGFGGFDLWKMTYVDGEFSQLVNLGPQVNSVFDELYPNWEGQNRLFASNRTDLGFGGFDIYRLESDGKISNLGIPINSPSDDVNPVVENGILSFISSNRERQILQVNQIQYVDTSIVFAELLGRIESDQNLAGKSIILTSQDSSEQRKVVLDKDGYFKVSQLKGLTNYSVSIPGIRMETSSQLILYNESGNIITKVRMSEKGIFVFELLTPEDYHLDKEENDDESLLAVDILGLFENNSPSEFVIALENSSGELIGITRTDTTGLFVFNEVVPDDKYTIRTEVQDPKGVIHIFDQNGNTIETIRPEDQNGYVHLRLKDEDQIITITNEDNISIKISEKENFKIPAIHFDSEDAGLTEESKENLLAVVSIIQRNPDVSIELRGHTDSRGKSEYNLRLSQKRIDSVMEYLISKGIQSSRISGEGYGETELLNNCDDSATCSDEEHALNRRTDIRLYQNKTKIQQP